jgi:hypothetical protein
LNPNSTKNQSRHGHKATTDVNHQKRIPVKERLGPVVSYAELLRASVNQHQATNGRPTISQNQISKISKIPEIMHAKDIVNDNEGGKATSKEKFLGFIPYKRIGKELVNESTPKLLISFNAEGKRRVTWGWQENEVEVAGTKEEGQCLGQAAKQPNSLVQVGHMETFSGPSQFEWGESSTPLIKPTRRWVPKSKEVVSIIGGPITNTTLAHYCNTKHDVVTSLENSRTPCWDLTPVAHASKQDFLWLRTSTVRDTRQSLQVHFYTGVNLSVPRNIAGYLGDDVWTLWKGVSTMAWVDSVEGESSRESHCLAVVPSDLSSKDASPLLLGDSNTVWVCRHRRKISIIFLFFIFLDTDPHLASVCVISISFPFRDMSYVCVGTCVRVCV